MGLGKTVQVVGLVCHLIEQNVPGPYLIVAPLSTLPNWMSEFERFAPKVYCYTYLLLFLASGREFRTALESVFSFFAF